MVPTSLSALYALALCCSSLLYAAGAPHASSYPSEQDKQFRQTLLDTLSSRTHQKTLPCGLRVICLESPHTNQVVVALLLAAGSTAERPDQYGMAHLVQYTTLQAVPGIADLARSFDLTLGSGCSATNTFDATLFQVTTDNKNWPVFAHLAATLFGDYLADEAVLYKEKAATLNQIRRYGHDANGFGFHDVFPANHPYAHPILGYKEQVLRYTTQDLRAFHAEHYLPSKATIIISGGVLHEEVFTRIEELFSRAPAATPQALPIQEPFYPHQPRIHKTHGYNTNHQECSYYFVGPSHESPEFVPLAYATNILSRRLQEVLVDKPHAPCLAASARLTSYALAGLVHINITLNPKEPGGDIDALIAQEIDRLIRQGITEEELAIIYQCETSNLIACHENPATFLAIMASFVTRSTSCADHFFAVQEAAKDISRKAVMHAAYTYLQPLHMHTQKSMPLSEEQKHSWQKEEERALVYDTLLINQCQPAPQSTQAPTRDLGLTPQRQSLEDILFPAWHMFTLPNGRHIFWLHSTASPRNLCALTLCNSTPFLLDEIVRGKKCARDLLPHLLYSTDTYTKKQFADECALHGITCTAVTTGIQCSAPAHTFEKALSLMTLALTKSQIPQDILDAKKQEEWHKTQAAATEGPARAIERFIHHTFFAQYPWVMDPEQLAYHLRTITRNDVLDALALLQSPHHSAAIFVGDFTEEQVRALALRYFNEPGHRPQHAPALATPHPTEEVHNIHISAETSHVGATLMRTIETPATHTTQALHLLMQAMQEKLTTLQMQEHDLYYAGTRMQMGNAYMPTVLTIQCVTSPHAHGRIMTQIKEYMQTLCTEGLSDETCATLSNTVLQKKGTSTITPDSLATVAVRALALDKPIDYEQQCTRILKNISAEAVYRVAADYFNPTQWSLITFGASPSQEPL